MRARIARLASIALLVSLLSACQMTVRLTTRVNASGGGTFSIGMDVDKELRDQLESARSGSGLASIQGLFDGLRDKGWATARTQPDGGLSFSATRSFKDEKGFDALLADLRSARGGEHDQFGGITLNLGFTTHKSFLKTNAAFRGTFDTSGGPAIDPELLKAMQGLVRFEIRAELPGAISTGDGNGTVSNGVAVWRPDLGSALTFSARSTAIRVGPLMLILIPALMLLAGMAWFALGRTRKEEPLIAIDLVDRVIPVEPEPEPESVFVDPVELDDRL